MGREEAGRLRRQVQDLGLGDPAMDQADGFEATRQIRAMERARGTAHVGIVALTANGLDTHNDRCKAAGMDGQLAKPFRSQDLAQALAQYLPRTHQPA